MVTIELPDDLYQRLGKQVKGFETPAQVIERLLTAYEVSFCADEMDQPNELSEIERVKRKIPKWFRNQHQICSQILITFLELTDQQDRPCCDYNLLAKRCAEKGIEPFETNYRQMNRIYIKNHAKVFDEDNGKVCLWEPVSYFIQVTYQKSCGEVSHV